MKKLSKNMSKRAARKTGSLPLIAILAAIAIIAIAAVTVVSRQKARQHTPANAKNFVTVKAGGQDLPVSGRTEIKPLTQQEAQEMVAAVKKMANQSTEGLTQVQHEDGSVSLDLQDRFQNVTIARQNEDGSVSTSCVDNPRSAARFFEVADDSSTNANRKQPVRRVDQ